MTITIKNEVYYTPKELSEKFGVDINTIRNWRKLRGLEGYLIGERKYFYSESAIERFIKGGK